MGQGAGVRGEVAAPSTEPALRERLAAA